MKHQQHNRHFDAERLAKRRRYEGFDYRTGKPAEMTGREWQDTLRSLRVEHNGDCVAAYDGASLELEVYDRD